MFQVMKKPAFRSKLSSIVTHTLPIRDIEKGMELIRTKKAAKVLLRPEW
jgi:threonine dehydrogenase-like Zn-dependent dehydrogenase